MKRELACDLKDGRLAEKAKLRPRLNLALSKRINQNSSVTLRLATDTRDCALFAWRSGARRAPVLQKSLMRCMPLASLNRSTMRTGLSEPRNQLSGVFENSAHAFGP
jgi:hypothetical protein